jgi:hypothetical protein
MVRRHPELIVLAVRSDDTADDFPPRLTKALVIRWQQLPEILASVPSDSSVAVYAEDRKVTLSLCRLREDASAKHVFVLRNDVLSV